jgi:hypothetical protein
VPVDDLPSVRLLPVHLGDPQCVVPLLTFDRCTGVLERDRVRPIVMDLDVDQLEIERGAALEPTFECVN